MKRYPFGYDHKTNRLSRFFFGKAKESLANIGEFLIDLDQSGPADDSNRQAYDQALAEAQKAYAQFDFALFQLEYIAGLAKLDMEALVEHNEIRPQKKDKKVKGK